MIPKRIKLSGFLSYRGEQEVAFDGSALWMLSGLNGSGKSSVFDAVTYALFGHHRGGSQGASDLINKAENGFAVEFDFLLDGAMHRVKRTLKRRSSGTAATQQVLRMQADGEWEPLADTQRKLEFDAWVRDHIGLNHDTFTSSVLLLQGRAEKLLDSTPKGRAEVLAGIVDLERFQRLHERADTQRKSLKGQVEALQNQLSAIADVSDMELLVAQNRIDAAAELAAAAAVEVERRQAIDFQAKQWVEVQRKLIAAQKRQTQARQLLQQAEDIERDLKRLKELRDVLPHLEVITHRRADLAKSEENTKALSQQLRGLEGQVATAEHQWEAAKLRRAEVQKRIATDEGRSREMAKRLPELRAQLERVRQADERAAEVKRLEDELAEFPTDLPKQISAALERIESLAGTERALSPLSRFAEARRELIQVRGDARDADRGAGEIKARGEEIRRRHDGLKPQFETVRVALKQADDKLTAQNALLSQALEARAELEALHGEKACRACGQPLTASHLRDEKARRDRAADQARERVRVATEDAAAARDIEAQLARQVGENERQLQEARETYREARSRSEQLKKDIERIGNECRRAFAELSEPFRERVAPPSPGEWAETTFPSAGELEEARRQVLSMPKSRREWEHARDLLTRQNGIKSQIDQARRALEEDRAAIDGDPAVLRRESTRLELEVNVVTTQLQTARDEERGAQTEIEQYAEKLANLRESVTERSGKMQTEEATQRLCHQAIAAARKSLAPEWQERVERIALAETNRLRGEREELERGGIEARGEELRAARIEAESLRLALTELEGERDQFPPDARRDPQDVLKSLAEARAIHAAKGDEVNAARNERTNLEARARQRSEVRNRLGEAERELRYLKMLAELLGRDRLQRNLLRQAERQIVDFSNNVLDRLSGGTLMLRLVGGDDGAPGDHALELEALNRATGQSPINVAFLSGSQRFRVAVSLALGIGQFASRLHRPIESVIIDEGFGCLDRNGRQVMIQELQNLRGHLQCILLVSHQEEFADAFADGYRFELTDGATKVTRLQR